MCYTIITITNFRFYGASLDNGFTPDATVDSVVGRPQVDGITTLHGCIGTVRQQVGNRHRMDGYYRGI